MKFILMFVLVIILGLRFIREMACILSIDIANAARYIRDAEPFMLDVMGNILDRLADKGKKQD